MFGVVFDVRNLNVFGWMFGRVRCSVFGWCSVMFGVRVRCCVLFVVRVAGCPGFPAGELAGGLDAQKVVPTAGPGVLNVCLESVPERVFVLCLCSCSGVGCSGVRVRVRLNTCCVWNPARAEHLFVFGERCSGAALVNSHKLAFIHYHKQAFIV